MTDNTPRLGHDPIPMNRIADDTGWENALKPGDFFFSREDGERTLCVVVPGIRTDGYENDPNAAQLRAWHNTIPVPVTGERAWGFDGNEDAPTLTPSLHVLGVWHGWIRAGKLVEA